MANQTPVPLKIADGGLLAPDRALAELGLNNLAVQQNWRTENGVKVKREGFDYFAPNGSSTAQRLSASSAVVAVRQILRPNGKSAVVAVESAGNIWAFSFDTSAWVQIGSGYTSGSVNWQIEEVAGYAIFNNPLKDLPCSWQVGDAAVTPIYELREQRIAAVGNIKEFNGQLHCEDLVEILESEFDGIMNGGTPYGPITDTSKIQRVAFKKTWSNFGTSGGGPRDFAATVLGTISATTNSLLLDYPVASLQDGDTIIVVGAGTAGGNLTTTISSGGGTNTLTLANNAITTATSRPVQKPDALSSVVGFYELEDDGAAITASVSFKNRHIILKGGSLYVGYYTGDLEEPYYYERVYQGKRTPRFPRTVVNVGDEYLWWVGDKNAYRWTLGSGRPTIDPLFLGCSRSLFFDRVKAADVKTVFAVDNPCNNEVFLFYQYESSGTQRRIIALSYAEGGQAVDEIDTGFTAGCIINKPAAGDLYSENELWFIFGGSDGKIVRNGKSNQEVFTQQRYGSSFYSEWKSGLGDFGDDTQEKDIHGYVLNMSDPTGSLAVEFSLYATNNPSIAPTLQETVTMNNPSYPGFAPLYYRNIYFQERIRTTANAAVRISSRTWLVSGVESKATTRVQS